MLIVGDNEKLRLLEEVFQHADKAANVGVVEGSVEFVEEREGTRLDHVDSEKERDSSHGALAAGEQRDVLRLLARRARDDVDATFQHIFAVHQRELSRAAVKQPLEHRLEIDIRFFEGVPEELRGLLVNVLDEIDELGLRASEISLLCGQKRMAFLNLLVLFDGNQVDRPHLLHFAADILDRHFGRVERRFTRFTPVRQRFCNELVEIDVPVDHEAILNVLDSHLCFRESKFGLAVSVVGFVQRTA